MKRKILYVVIILIVAAGIIGYRLYSKQTPDVVKQEPQVSVSAAELVAAFEKDTAAASQRFLDKVVQVSGNVKSVDTSGAVVLGEEGSGSEVVIGLDRRYKADAAKLKAGTVATLQGVCSGYTSGSTDPADMLASLGTTVQLRSAGIKEKK